jgi:hypothetical protein
VLGLVAFVLQSNGAAGGTQPFTAPTGQTIGSIATGQAPSAQQIPAAEPVRCESIPVK